MAAGACGGVRFFLGPAGGSAIREPPLNLPQRGRGTAAEGGGGRGTVRSFKLAPHQCEKAQHVSRIRRNVSCIFTPYRSSSVSLRSPPSPKGKVFAAFFIFHFQQNRKQSDFPGEGFSPSGISFGHSGRGESNPLSPLGALSSLSGESERDPPTGSGK